MRFVFVSETVHRKSNKLSYETLNFQTGFSGTETMIVEVATCLAHKGHDVYVWGKHLVPHEDRGVKYVDVMPGTDGVDVFVPMFFLYDPTVLDAISHLSPDTLIVPWLQCILYSSMWGVANIYLQNRNVVVVSPSLFGMKHVPSHLSDRHVIPNGINPRVFAPVDEGSMNARVGTWIFAACWERGGAVAARVFTKYPHRKRFISAAYFAPETCPTDVEIERLGSVSKSDLRNAMMQSDYFVYPLVLPDNRVHHDTFACCVLEAMACGVIVVSWKAACLPEVYGKHAVLIDAPEYTSGSPETAFGASPAMRSEASVDALLAAVCQLDENPAEKHRIRVEAARWARTQTWDSVTDAFQDVIATHDAAREDASR